MSEAWEWGYVCPHCETRFSNHVELELHMINEHGFKRTIYSRSARYWRHHYRPLSKAEKKLKAITELVNEDDEVHFVGGHLGLEIRKILERNEE